MDLLSCLAVKETNPSAPKTLVVHHSVSVFFFYIQVFCTSYFFNLFCLLFFVFLLSFFALHYCSNLAGSDIPLLCFCEIFNSMWGRIRHCWTCYLSVHPCHFLYWCVQCVMYTIVTMYRSTILVLCCQMPACNMSNHEGACDHWN